MRPLGSVTLTETPTVLCTTEQATSIWMEQKAEPEPKSQKATKNCPFTHVNGTQPSCCAMSRDLTFYSSCVI